MRVFAEETSLAMTSTSSSVAVTRQSIGCAALQPAAMILDARPVLSLAWAHRCNRRERGSQRESQSRELRLLASHALRPPTGT
jgi:hypothetical protein